MKLLDSYTARKLDVTPPALPPMFEFLECCARSAIPRGYLDTWFVRILPALARECFSTKGNLLTDDEAKAYGVLDLEPITPVLNEPANATHIITVRYYTAPKEN